MSKEPASNSEHIVVNVSARLMDFSDDELLSRLRNFEDHFVERKSTGDSKDWVKTTVAFANSVPIGYPAILFLGVTNEGAIEGRGNLDSLQQTFSKMIAEAYPPIYYAPRVVTHDGKQCLAVIIPGSDARPHFAGPSYIREGSQTKKASESQFASLISQRNSKAYEILKWKGKQLTVQFPPIENTFQGNLMRHEGMRTAAILEQCNQFYVTVQLLRGESNTPKYSYPLRFVELSYDDQKDRAELIFTRHVH